jgi:hypothetical protein
MTCFKIPNVAAGAYDIGVLATALHAAQVL